MYHVRGGYNWSGFLQPVQCGHWLADWADCEKVKYENAGSSPGDSCWLAGAGRDPRSPGLDLTVHRHQTG